MCGQVLDYPMLDDRGITASTRQFDGIGVWDRVSNEAGWRALLGDAVGTDAVSPYAAPARATDLSGLPAAFIDVGATTTAQQILPVSNPRLSNDAEFFPGMPKTWALTFMINEEEAPTGRTAGSLAWAGLANCYYWIDRERGLGGYWATQIFPFGHPTSVGGFLAMETAVYDHATVPA